MCPWRFLLLSLAGGRGRHLAIGLGDVKLAVLLGLLAGLAGSAVVALFLAFPPALVAVVAGLALLATIAANLVTVSAEGPHRDAAMLTFLLTASGVSFFGIASAFWGLLLGVVVLLLQQGRRRCP